MPITDRQGRVIKWYGTSTDIDDLKRAEETLQQSEEQLRLALESGRMGTWDWSIMTGELKWSDNLEEIHGMAPGSFGGTFADFEQIIHPEDREVVNQAIAQAIELKSIYDIEFRIFWPDGTTHWMAGKGKTFCNAEGKAVRMVGVGMDVTERRRNEEAQRYLALASKVLSSSLDYQTTLASVAQLTVPKLADWCTVHVIEEDNSIEQLAAAHVDPAKVKWAMDLKNKYPFDPNAPRGAAFTLRTQQPDLLPDISDELLVQGARDAEHLQLLREIGFKSVMTVPLLIQDRILGVISFISTEDSGRRYDGVDLSLAEELGRRAALAVENARLYRAQERERARAEAANRIKDEFLAVLSHELRTPLNPILGWTQLLKSRNFDEEKTIHALDIIERNAKLQSQLIEDLLDVSRILQGKLQLEFQPIALHSVIGSAIDTVRLAAQAKSIQIETRLTSVLGQVAGNSARLQQVIWNLLSNAIKFTPQGGRVEIVLQRADDYAQIKVSDTGTGIDLDFLPYVFDYFRQADSKTTRTFGGLGLGLAIVRHLVELHGGTVWADSPGKGQGATFTIHFPLMTNTLKTDDDGKQANEGGSLKGIRVLVVDDEPDMREFVAFVLEEYGAQVTVAKSAAEALFALEESIPDLLLSDIGMPDRDGYMLMRQVRTWSSERGGQILAIALSAYAGEFNQQQALSAGFQAHISKPVEPEQLVRAITNLIGSTTETCFF
jgi:PAS domain S-box-containing protein